MPNFDLQNQEEPKAFNCFKTHSWSSGQAFSSLKPAKFSLLSIVMLASDTQYAVTVSSSPQGVLRQGLLELLWTIRGKITITYAENQEIFKTLISRFIKNTMHKKGLKFRPVVELVRLNFTYITIVK